MMTCGYQIPSGDYRVGISSSVDANNIAVG